jgi:aspartate/methionine/tyrosine aminotransferase
VDPGDQVLLADPGYPCNRNFVRLVDGEPVGVAVGPDSNYQLTPELLAQHWGSRTAAAIVATPSNPTGTLVPSAQLKVMVELARERGGTLIVDEIYHGLVYEGDAVSALTLAEDVFIVNSFSKYFNMTGWRLGWLVVPDALVPVVERLAQNLFICASTVSQYAALACFEPESIAEYERRRAEFKARRDWFIPQLDALGLKVPVVPDGAFYAWADCSAFGEKLGISNSWDFAFEAMKKAHLAITPGRDFGSAETARFVRFSTASSMAHLEESVERLRAWAGATVAA